ncbi:MAG: putative flap endonuclease-1-like 5' DNA nuclease [Maribacter sp.]|jgi:predicted flap endonuclease-1-like 5' DNA nuclease
MCIWLPLLFMIGSAILGWLIGRGWLQDKLGLMKKNVEAHQKLYAETKAKHTDTELEFKTLSTSYGILEKEKDNLSYSISDLKLRIDTEKKTITHEINLRYRALEEEYEQHRNAWKIKIQTLENEKEEMQSELALRQEQQNTLLAQINDQPKEIDVIREIEVIKEVVVIKEIEVIKEVPVEIIREVEVVKSFDMDMLQEMMSKMQTVEVSRTVKKVKPPTVVHSPGRDNDDLKKIEGIGPKIEEVLNNGEIYTFSQLSQISVEAIKDILLKAGKRYKMHDPSTWQSQAKLAAEDKWEELQELQDKQNGEDK